MPDLEKGFIRIATGKKDNDVVTALVKANLIGTEYQLILVILRKTWGFGKKKDWISLTQFENITGKSRPMIWKTLEKLGNKRIIVKKSSRGKLAIYQFNKDFKSWKLGNSSTIVLQNYSTVVNQLGNSSKPNYTTAVNPQKKLLQKKLYKRNSDSRNHLVELVLKEFKNLIGHLPTDHKPRFEAYNLVRRLNSFLKDIKKEVNEENSKKAITAYFNWVSKQSWAEKVQTLSIIRRNTNIFYAEAIEPKLERQNEKES